MLEFVKALAAENQFCYFREPVTEREAPDYLAVISHPMDFGTIASEKLVPSDQQRCRKESAASCQ